VAWRNLNQFAPSCLSWFQPMGGADQKATPATAAAAMQQAAPPDGRLRLALLSTPRRRG
jgi:hypothetical protein